MEVEIIKRNRIEILRLKTIITKKISLQEFNSRFKLEEEQVKTGWVKLFSMRSLN